MLIRHLLVAVAFVAFPLLAIAQTELSVPYNNPVQRRLFPNSFQRPLAASPNEIAAKPAQVQDLLNRAMLLNMQQSPAQMRQEELQKEQLRTLFYPMMHPHQ